MSSYKSVSLGAAMKSAIDEKKNGVGGPCVCARLPRDQDKIVVRRHFFFFFLVEISPFL